MSKYKRENEEELITSNFREIKLLKNNKNYELMPINLTLLLK